MKINEIIKKNVYKSLEKGSIHDDFIKMEINEKINFIEIFSKSRFFHYLVLSKEKFNFLKDVSFYEDEYKKHTIQTILVLSEAKRIKKLLNKNDYIFLKGVHLISNFYKDASKRPTRDLDILVHEDHIDEVANILINNGYRFRSFLNEDKVLSSKNYTYDLPPLVSNHGIRIELHHSIENSIGKCRFTYNFLKNKTNENFLSTEDLILHLIYHATKKQGPDVGLAFLSDILIIFKSKLDIDLEYLYKHSDVYGIKKEMFLAFKAIDKNIYVPRLREFLEKYNFSIDNDLIEKFEVILIFNTLNSLDYSILKLFHKLKIKNILKPYSRDSISRRYNVNKKSYKYLILLVYRLFFHTLKLFNFFIKNIFNTRFREDYKINREIYNYLYKK